jgi:hypothetical protein
VFYVFEEDYAAGSFVVGAGYHYLIDVTRSSTLACLRRSSNVLIEQGQQCLRDAGKGEQQMFSNSHIDLPSNTRQIRRINSNLPKPPTQ